MRTCLIVIMEIICFLLELLIPCMLLFFAYTLGCVTTSEYYIYQLAQQGYHIHNDINNFKLVPIENNK